MSFFNIRFSFWDSSWAGSTRFASFCSSRLNVICFGSNIELNRLNLFVFLFQKSSWAGSTWFFSKVFLTIKLSRLKSMLGQFNIAQTVFFTTRPKHLKRAIFTRKSIRARARAGKKNEKKGFNPHRLRLKASGALRLCACCAPKVWPKLGKSKGSFWIITIIQWATNCCMIWSYCQAVWVSPSPPPPTHSQQHPCVQLSFYTFLNPPPPLFLPGPPLHRPHPLHSSCNSSIQICLPLLDCWFCLFFLLLLRRVPISSSLRVWGWWGEGHTDWLSSFTALCR